MEIKITPEKLGFVTEAEALAMGATPAVLARLDFLKMHGRKHFRNIDVQKALSHVWRRY